MTRHSKTNVLVVFGGASSEHEVSLMSAESVIKFIDHEQYHVVAAGITKDGRMELHGDLEEMNSRDWNGFNQAVFSHDENQSPLFFSPGTGSVYQLQGKRVVPLEVDVVFPILHGPFGEDGRFQGLLEMCGIPYVGAGVLASAAAMDKGITKRLLQQAGIPQTEYREYRIFPGETEIDSVFRTIDRDMAYPLFIKPANLGSSLGISRVERKEQLMEAVRLATEYDTKILAEKAVDAREIECAVLGSRQPAASIPGEVLPSKTFYDYEDKYLSGASRTQVPARLTDQQVQSVQKMAVQVYRLLECQGMARVDFFLDNNSGALLVNEINTLPGFTAISLYPKMWEASGVSYAELIHRLIQDAMEKGTALGTQRFR